MDVKKLNMTTYLLAGCSSFEAVLELLSAARTNLNEILSAFEFIDSEAMLSVTAHLGVSNPITSSSFYVLIETSGSNAAHDEQKLETFLDSVTSSGLVTDGTIATVPSKIKVAFLIMMFLKILFLVIYRGKWFWKFVETLIFKNLLLDSLACGNRS